jgi:hypothetical protein
MLRQFSAMTTIAVAVLTVAPALASSAISVPSNRETRVYRGVGGGRVCFVITDAETGLPAEVQLRRKAAGQPRDLGSNVGGRCLTLKGVIYEVFVISPKPVLVRITREDLWIGPLSGAS